MPERPAPQQMGENGIAEPDRLPGEGHPAGGRSRGTECRGHRRGGVRGQVAPDEHAEGNDEAGERAGSTDVEQLAPVQHRAPDPDEGAQRPDRRQGGRDRQEERGRHVDVIAPGRDIVSRLVHQQDPEQRHREAPPLQDLAPIALDQSDKELPDPDEHTAEPMGLGRVPHAGEGGPRSQREHHGEQEEQGVEPPARRASAGQRPHQHQPGFGRIGPVPAARPGSEHGLERRRAATMLGQHQRVDHLAGPEAHDAPGGQKRDQLVHRAS